MNTFLIINAIVWTILGVIFIVQALKGGQQVQRQEPLSINISISTRTVHPNDAEYQVIRNIN